MVKKVAPDGTVTVYLGVVEYEISGGTTETTSYYNVPGARVVRVNTTLSYVLTDHLGSSSVTLDDSGGVVGELRYYAYGETRVSSGSTPTDRRYTGQTEHIGIGLYYYNARWYHPHVNRWVQPDTIVPSAAHPQTYNRYTYAANNPIRHNDPDGHCAPFCTAAVGALIGAAVGAGIYVASSAVSGRTMNLQDGLIAAGVGMVGGALIGTGVGAAGGVAAFTALATGASTAGATGVAALAVTGAGVGALTGQAGYSFGAGQDYNSSDMYVAASVGSVSGALSGGVTGVGFAVPGAAPFAPAARMLISGGAGYAQSALTDTYNERPVDQTAAAYSGGVGLVTGFINESIGAPNFGVVNSLFSQPVNRYVASVMLDTGRSFGIEHFVNRAREMGAE